MPCDGLERRIHRWLPLFGAFTAFTPEIPKLYWDVKSQEQRYFLICENLHKIICYLDCMSNAVNTNHDEIEKLKELFEQFINGNFNEFYEKQINEWIDEHMPEIISRAIKMVFFGLTTDGYFCAYIPVSWAGINFDTIMDYSRDDYGSLVLEY